MITPLTALLLFLTIALGATFIARSSETIKNKSNSTHRTEKNRNRLTPFVIKSKYHKALR